MARILIVEDETSQRCLMNDLLTRSGHEAVATCGPLDAAQVADWFQPEVVVSDCHPRVDQTGLEAAEALRGTNPKVRLVFVTPEQTDSLEQGASHLRPFRVVNQPWGYHELLGAVNAALD
jgi:DNA-binding NtrC family response regulator